MKKLLTGVLNEKKQQLYTGSKLYIILKNIESTIVFWYLSNIQGGTAQMSLLK